MNPLNNQPQMVPTQNNIISEFMQVLNNGGSPQQFAMNMLSQNPQLNQMMQQLANMYQGQHPRDIVMQLMQSKLMQSKGIDPSQIMQIANRMGLK